MPKTVLRSAPPAVPAVRPSDPARPENVALRGAAAGFRPLRGGIYTYTRRYVSPLALRPSDIVIEDIAHALALVNRFAGHTSRPISVAQHSVYVSRLCEGPHALQALLHDASEAYLGDVTKWLKAEPEMEHYRRAEARAQRVICRVFGVSSRLHTTVEVADRLMVRYEAFHVWGPRMPLFQRPDYPPPTPEECDRVGAWKPWPWKWARESFLERFHTLLQYKDRV